MKDKFKKQIIQYFMMNHNNSKYVNPSNNKTTTHKLKLYPNTNKQTKSLILIQRETKQKAKCKLKL